MNRPGLNQAFKVLGLEPGAAWEEVRQRYRRLVFAAHPDRHKDDALARNAEDRMKEINMAFEILKAHYCAHGADAARSGHTVTDESGAKRRVDSDGLEGTFHTFSRASVAAGVIGAAAISITALVLMSRYGPDQPPRRIPAETRYAKAGESAFPQLTAPPATRDASGGIRVGSTMDEVLNMFGVPTQTDGDTWRYGDSRVVFRNRAVIDWDFNVGLPSRDGEQDEESDTRFGIGSTMADVRRVQGAPIAGGGTQWTYGPSRVYFENGRVSGWYSSPLQPLKTAER